MKFRESSVITKSNKITSSIREDIFGPPLFAFLFLGLLLYANTFANFWTFDDYFVVLDNPDITSWQNFLANSYVGRPLRELSAMLDYKLFGFNPFGWHFQNILWHTLNAWLVYVLSMLLFEERRIAWIAATLFLVHPIQVEVVAQVSHRKDSLSLFFMLGSFVCYLLFRDEKRIIFLLLSVLCISIAFFAKQNALVFPFFVLLSEAFFSRKKLKSKVVSRALIAAVCVAWGASLAMHFSSYNFLARANDLLMQNNYFDGFDWSVYPLAVLSSWALLLSKLVHLKQLSVSYLVPIPESFFDLRVLVTLVVLCFYVFSLYYTYIRNNKLFIPLLWFGLLYLPTSNIVPITQLAADRYLYAPSVGLFMVFAVASNRIIANRFLVAVLIFTFFGLSLMTLQQNRTWQNNLTLWEKSLEVNPGSVRAISNVAELRYGDDMEKSLSMQMRAFETNPYDPFVCFKIGELYERLGQEEKAKVFYKKAYEAYNTSLRRMYDKSYYTSIKQKLVAFNISVH